MRNNLILKFHCSECGSRLNLVYNKGNHEKHGGSSVNEVPNEPTGADCRYMPEVQVEPCKPCIDKHIGPAKKLLEAVKEINGIDL